MSEDTNMNTDMNANTDGSRRTARTARWTRWTRRRAVGIGAALSRSLDVYVPPVVKTLGIVTLIECMADLATILIGHEASPFVVIASKLIVLAVAIPLIWRFALIVSRPEVGDLVIDSLDLPSVEELREVHHARMRADAAERRADAASLIRSAETIERDAAAGEPSPWEGHLVAVVKKADHGSGVGWFIKCAQCGWPYPHQRAYLDYRGLMRILQIANALESSLPRVSTGVEESAR